MSGSSHTEDEMLEVLCGLQKQLGFHKKRQYARENKNFIR